MLILNILVFVSNVISLTSKVKHLKSFVVIMFSISGNAALALNIIGVCQGDAVARRARGPGH